MTITTKQGGYFSASSALNTPEGEYVTLSELLAMPEDEYPNAIGSDLRPANILDIASEGTQLTMILRTESGAGIVATEDHKILRVVENSPGNYTFHHTALADFEVGDFVMVNPHLEGGNLNFILSPVESVTPMGLEEVYSVKVDSEDGGFLVNDIVNLGSK